MQRHWQIGYTRHRAKNTTQKTKKMKNMDATEIKQR
jgi:hypothetical protein